MLFLPKKGYLQCRGFMRFDDKSHLPNLPAVYFVLGDKQLLYIGMTIDLKQRFLGHHRMSDFLGTAEYILWANPKDNQSLQQAENDFIAAFQPPLNKTTPTNASGLSRKIKHTREQHRMSVAQLSDLLHISRQTLWRIESGIIEPTLLHKLAIERVFNVSLDDIFFDD